MKSSNSSEEISYDFDDSTYTFPSSADEDTLVPKAFRGNTRYPSYKASKTALKSSELTLNNKTEECESQTNHGRYSRTEHGSKMDDKLPIAIIDYHNDPDQLNNNRNPIESDVTKKRGKKCTF